MTRKLMLLMLFFSVTAVADNVVYQSEWINDDDMTSTLRKMDDNRLFPCIVEGKLEGIEILYQGSYCPFLPDMNFFYSRWGLSDKWYSEWAAYYKSIGMTEYSHTTFIDLSGSTVHQATWILIGDFSQPEKDESEQDEKSSKKQQ